MDIDDGLLIVRALAHVHENKADYRSQQNFLDAFSQFAMGGAGANVPDVHFDLSEINRYLKARRIPKDDKRAFLRQWLEAVHADVLDIVRARLELELYAPFFHSVRQSVDDTSPLASGEEELDRLRGIYRLFRRSPFFPDEKVLVSRLTIGDRHPPVDAKLEARYTNEDGDLQDSIATGTIAPFWGQHAIALLHYHPKGTALMLFEQMSFDEGGSGHVRSATGVLTNLMSGTPSSAWPFFLERTAKDAPVEPAEVAMTSIGDLPVRIPDLIERGFVDWRHR